MLFTYVFLMRDRGFNHSSKTGASSILCRPKISSILEANPFSLTINLGAFGIIIITPLHCLYLNLNRKAIKCWICKTIPMSWLPFVALFTITHCLVALSALHNLILYCSFVGCGAKCTKWGLKGLTSSHLDRNNLFHFQPGSNCQR